MKTKWNEKSTADKIMLVLMVVISLVVLVAAVLQITGVWDKALNVAIPLLSVFILIQCRVLKIHIRRKTYEIKNSYACCCSDVGCKFCCIC